MAMVIALGLNALLSIDNPLSIRFGVYTFHLSVTVAVIVLVSVIVTVMVGFWLIKALWTMLMWPIRTPQTRSYRYIATAVDTFIHGISNIYAGATNTGTKQITKAGRALGNAALSQVVLALCPVPKDSVDYKLLLQTPNTHAFAVARMLAQTHSTEQAGIDVLEQALAITPKHHTLQQALFAAYVRHSNWQMAERVLVAQYKHRMISKDNYKRCYALLLLARFDCGDGMVGTDVCLKAYAALPTFAPVAVYAARAMAHSGKTKRAAVVLGTAWAHSPHPMLAQAFAALAANESTQTHRQRFAAWIKPNTDKTHAGGAGDALDAPPPDFYPAALHAELLLADGLAIAAYDALQALVQDYPCGRVFMLLADCCYAMDHGAEGDDWLYRTIGAGATRARWQCRACQHEQQTWAAVCLGCSGFDTLVWHEPKERTVARYLYKMV